jgi:16S rRNA (uracil1498-N3)-methyltransferase
VSAPRFFVSPGEASIASDSELSLPASITRHALQVLRLRTGDAIVLFDGRGGEYPATLTVSGREAHARVGSHSAIERETDMPVTLVQALVAADVMDDIVRKAVELGTHAIVPVLAERSQHAPADRLDRRVVRWRQIAVSACEQCGRNRVPTIEAVTSLRAWVARRGALSDMAVLEPRASQRLADVAGRVHGVLIGPEGGLTDEEVALATSAGAVAVSLGARTLRADTAATAALGVVVSLRA